MAGYNESTKGYIKNTNTWKGWHRMGLNGFRLHGIKGKLLLACSAIVVFGCAMFGVANFVSSQKEVQASSDNNHLQDVTLDQMTKMEVGAVYTGAFDETAGPIGSVQSLAITDKYFVVTQLGSNSGNWGMLTATSLKNPSSTPAWSVSHGGVGHGNGATWNSKTNEIVVASGEDSSGPGILISISLTPTTVVEKE